ncbi:hypothetical protein EVAR_76403_1 [Eumeta japonica]|uniref:Uncharacterized protein n=1 Tax=Eumeta variegata TaxID=151549 RepID=A0A4C1TAW8_EUMVA|nr:hypothetical protein EVAR_76403_1 [Eumeta japonica]
MNTKTADVEYSAFDTTHCHEDALDNHRNAFNCVLLVNSLMAKRQHYLTQGLRYAQRTSKSLKIISLAAHHRANVGLLRGNDLEESKNRIRRLFGGHPLSAYRMQRRKQAKRAADNAGFNRLWELRVGNRTEHDPGVGVRMERKGGRGEGK